MAQYGTEAIIPIGVWEAEGTADTVREMQTLAIDRKLAKEIEVATKWDRQVRGCDEPHEDEAGNLVPVGPDGRHVHVTCWVEVAPKAIYMRN